MTNIFKARLLKRGVLHYKQMGLQANEVATKFVFPNFEDEGRFGADGKGGLWQEEGDGAPRAFLDDLGNGVLRIGSANPPTRAIAKIFLIKVGARDFYQVCRTRMFDNDRTDFRKIHQEYCTI